METVRYFRNPDGTVLMLSGVNCTVAAPQIEGIEEIPQDEYEAEVQAHAAKRQRVAQEAEAAERLAAKEAYKALLLLPGMTPQAAKHLAGYVPETEAGQF